MPTDRLARLRSWPSGVYTDALARLWRDEHPLRTTTLTVPRVPRAAASRRIAAVCHVFYLDLLDEVAGALASLPPGSDVFISVVDESTKSSVLDRLADRVPGRLDVRVVENRGRDIAPKYVAFADVHQRGYELLLFLHTKKSSYADGTGTPWRKYLFGALAGTPARVDGVLALFDRDPHLGILAPQHFGAVAADTVWQGTFVQATRLARRMQIQVVRWAPPDFASGSMFWARPEALVPIMALHLGMEDFPPEARQVTATNMHALERLVFIAAGRAGYGSALLRPEDGAPTPALEPRPPSTPARPPIGMWLQALPPTLRRMAADVEIRRQRFAPRRLMAEAARLLRRTQPD